MEKSFTEMGYKTAVKELSDFHDDFGLKAGDDDEDEEEEEDEEDYSDGSEGSEEDSEED
jgi:hypothetical protein